MHAPLLDGQDADAAESGASRIEFGPECQAVEALGVYRLMIADDGQGMDPENIETSLNTFGGLGIPDTRVRRCGPITTSRPGRRSGTKRHNFGADRHTPGTTDR